MFFALLALYLQGITKKHNTMKKSILTSLAASLLIIAAPTAKAQYTPSPEVIKNQKEFANDRFGIFIHWGIYSMFAQGEWYLNYGPDAKEYAKAASAFYPTRFNAGQWADAFKEAGAEYVCFTTRHHDGFSMFHTKQSPYNIVDATPFKRDVLKELSDSLASRGIKLHLYYSHIDWTRQDYPRGRTGLKCGNDPSKYNWKSYYNFMNAQLKELLTGYGPIRAVWFDGWWDHDEDKTPFNWHLKEQYEYVHSLQPGVLIANNHHQTPFEGEDIQIFERDLPGENVAGLSGQDVSKLPLETCNTMNNIWGYRLTDQEYKDSATLIRYLVKAAGMGANLLLNIGPQPNGELPEAAIARMKDMGKWMRQYGYTLKGTQAGPFEAQDWGTSTSDGKTVYIHVLKPGSEDILLPTPLRIKEARTVDGNRPVKFTLNKRSVTLHLDITPDVADYIIRLSLK